MKKLYCFTFECLFLKGLRDSERIDLDANTTLKQCNFVFCKLTAPNVNIPKAFGIFGIFAPCHQSLRSRKHPRCLRMGVACARGVMLLIRLQRFSILFEPRHPPTALIRKSPGIGGRQSGNGRAGAAEGGIQTDFWGHPRHVCASLIDFRVVKAT